MGNDYWVTFGYFFGELASCAYDQNIQYLSLAFWQIIMTAGPILAIALSIGLLIGLVSSSYFNSGNDLKFLFPNFLLS